MAINGASGAYWENPYSVANRESFYSSYNSTGGSSTSNALSSYGLSSTSLSTSAQNFLVDAKSSGSSLLSILGDLRNGASFNGKTAVSSDKDTLSIKSVNSKYANDMSDMSVRVDQIATTQKNVGSEMAATGRIDSADASAGSGYKYFEIETGGKTTTISVKVNSGDTNEAIQKKMAEAINSKNLGITAKVTTTDGKSTLSVESNATGVKNEGRDNFTIRDISSGGTIDGEGIAAWAGITQTTQKAQDAVYSVNGGAAITSKTNDVDLGNGVTATLKSASANEAKITLGKDTLSGINAVRNLVNEFNSFLEAAEGNKDDRKTSFLYNQLVQLSKTYDNRLKEIGISFNSSGYLKIDEDAMKTAAESGKLESFFKNDGANYGFANQLERIVGNVNRDPSQYVTKAEYRNNTSVSYLQDYRYNQIINQGMLFDLMS